MNPRKNMEYLLVLCVVLKKNLNGGDLNVTTLASIVEKIFSLFSLLFVFFSPTNWYTVYVI